MKKKISKVRRTTMGRAIKRAEDKLAEQRREIYERALPQFQQYPPMLLNGIKTKLKPVAVSEPSRIARLHSSADGRRFQTNDKRQYEYQADGSVRVLNKPPSRVKRQREGLTKPLSLKAA